MQYMLLIYNDEAAWQGLSETELNGITNEYFAFTDSIRESGNFVTGAPLQPTTMSTSVRVRDGEQLVTDGPFAETKEQLGSCYRLSSKAQRIRRLNQGVQKAFCYLASHPLCLLKRHRLLRRLELVVTVACMLP